MRKLNSQQRRVRSARIQRNTAKLHGRTTPPNITPMTSLHLDKDAVFERVLPSLTKPEVKEEVVLPVQPQEVAVDQGTNAASA